MTPVDQRPFRRVSFFASAARTSVDDGYTLETHTFIISRGGVGLYCYGPLPIGCRISATFLFTTPTGKTSLQGPVRGRVVHFRFDDNVAFLGVRFDRPLRRSATPTLARAVAELLFESSSRPKPPTL